jgi:2-oxoisovalerate dehydrogenase E2 component (dihydrolipoyl transacylase)
MSTAKFNLPDVGEGLTEAEIVAWRVAPGDTVEVNQVIVEIETAKSLVELPSPYAGVVSELLVAEGDTVEVGTPIITVTAEGAQLSSPLTTPAQAALPGEVQVTVGYGTGGHAVTRRSGRRAAPAAPTGPLGGTVVAKPPIRKFAKELGVDLGTVTATGSRGEVTRDDVIRHASQASVFRNIQTPEWPESRE